MAHGYDIVDYALVWSILETNIPVVADKVRQLLAAEAARSRAGDLSLRAVEWLDNNAQLVLPRGPA